MNTADTSSSPAATEGTGTYSDTQDAACIPGGGTPPSTHLSNQTDRIPEAADTGPPPGSRHVGLPLTSVDDDDGNTDNATQNIQSQGTPETDKVLAETAAQGLCCCIKRMVLEPSSTSARDNDVVSPSHLSKSELDMLGVSVHWLKTGFTEEVRAAGFGESATVYDIEPAVIQAKGQDLVCPVDGRPGSSYTHALLLSDSHSHAVGPSNFMLSYAWGYKVTDIVDSLFDYCTSHNLPTETTYVWICCLCNNQHSVKEVVPFEKFHAIFDSRVKRIKNILAMMEPWNKPGYLTRIWCIFEFYTASQDSNCSVTIIMPQQEHQAFRDALLQDVEKTTNTLYEALSSTRIQNATATQESDKQNIFRIIEDSDGGYVALNHQVNERLRFWAIQLGKSLAAVLDKKHSSKNQNAQAANEYMSVGWLFEAFGDHNSALVEYRKCLAIREAVLGKDHPDTATTYNNIGSVLMSQGD